MASPELKITTGSVATRRPWGSYVVLDEDQGHKTKLITVQPGGRLSYQRHRCRAEHWFIVTGDADITVDGCAFRLGEGESLDIPCGAAHRVANPGAGDLVLVEVQTGTYFGEDDVERLADDYGRATLSSLEPPDGEGFGPLRWD